MIINEVAILNTLDHPNIVKYFETYDDERYLYLVMQYIKGIELFDKIIQEKKLTEKKAANYFEKLLYAMNYCH